MKPKISAEEYKSILDKIELADIYLTETHSKQDKENLGKGIELTIKEKYKYTQDDQRLIIAYKYTFIGTCPDKEKPGIEIVAIYNIVYTKGGQVSITDEFFEPFERFILKMMIWTYFREYIQNTIIRMNLPPLTLPLKRL